ncbi:endonuclease NucS domain-containing protein [Rhizobium sp. C4]|uniref:endonuclease NucS domain-containing protein n=1 Tax=Rhizobium sp. C4 TaxID=1349800 RepID=UPI001E2DD27A|nr:endonuclease NucS domain-containing protein [Rhizobium sp. C4]
MMTDILPVLGKFKDEGGLRDYIAANLHAIEPGLTHLKTEYTLANDEGGTGGRIDILARDALRHVTCIEVKRSEKSERTTLNELSKYITLLVKQDRVPREQIRCIVASTSWNELLLPLSYFATFVGVDVQGIKVTEQDGRIMFEPVELLPMEFLPQLSPEISILEFETSEDRASHIDYTKERSSRLPFVRIALLLLDPSDNAAPRYTTYRTIVFTWRIAPAHDDEIERVIGNSIGWLFPYGFPGWEAEADVSDWIAEGDGAPHIMRIDAESRRGTPEKIDRLLAIYQVNSIVRLGDWPASEFVNDDETLILQIRAQSSMSGSGQLSRHVFSATVNPKYSSSWKSERDSFLRFLSFEPRWRKSAEEFLGQLTSGNLTVELIAYHKSNIFYTIYQATASCQAALSEFAITVRRKDTVVGMLAGYYLWDGFTSPGVNEAKTNMTMAYGSPFLTIASLFSAQGNEPKIDTMSQHGFVPTLMLREGDQYTVVEGLNHALTINEFVRDNPEYSAEVARLLNSTGPLPADPLKNAFQIDDD